MGATDSQIRLAGLNQTDQNHAYPHGRAEESRGCVGCEWAPRDPDCGRSRLGRVVSPHWLRGPDPRHLVLDPSDSLHFY